MTKFNFYLGGSVSAWLLTILIITAELFAPFKAFLKSTFTHHWIGKAVIITLAFIISGFLMREKETNEKVAWYSTLSSLLIIFLFYIIEFLT